MKILVHGMQSSGSTTFALLMSQRANTICVLDLYCGSLAPPLIEESKKYDIVLKCTVSNMRTIDEHIESFAPDLTILFTRPIEDIVESLSNRKCRNHCGKMEEKVELYKQILENQKRFDIVFSYAEMINKEIERLNWIDQSAYDLKRKPQVVIDFNCENSTWCRENLWLHWGRGGTRKSGDSWKIENL